MELWNNPKLVAAAAMAPHVCATRNGMTFLHSKSRNVANAMVMAGLRWAPEMEPVTLMATVTAIDQTNNQIIDQQKRTKHS